MTAARNLPIWPFPGQASAPWWECYPPHNLPPPRFAPGDRVTTRWGTATVLQAYDYEHFDGRAYQIRYDGSSAPPGFGHRWSEADMQPLAERAAEPEPDEVIEPEQPRLKPVKVPAQSDLFEEMSHG